MATKQILVSLEVSGDISDDNDNTIYDYNNSYIPDSILQKTWGADRDANNYDIKNLGRVIYSSINGGTAVSDFAAGERISGGDATS